ncbi:MAG: hypothetical protein ACR2F1_11580 [Nitrososphaeraceae archaeon]
MNKFEKEKRVKELHLEGKTIREIAKEVYMSFRDIGRIIKRYANNKLRLESKRESPIQIRKLLRCTKAYILFLNGKSPVEVAIDLQLDYGEVRKYWTEFMRLQNMKDLANIYIDNEYNLDYLLHIYFFMLRNNIPKKDCEIVLRNADNVINLNIIYHNKIIIRFTFFIFTIIFILWIFGELMQNYPILNIEDIV